MRHFLDTVRAIPGLVWVVYFFAIGTVIGSFLNVCIYRIPLKKSIVRPRSYCPHCGEMIRWYRNIPLVSYCLLLGRAACCGGRISPLYPFVEFLTGGYFVLLFHYYGISIPSLIYAVFGCATIVLIFVDLHHLLLPAVITFPGVALGFASSFINPLLNPWQSGLGIVIGGLIPITVLVLYKWIRKKEGLGHGDIVMLAMVGAFLGWKAVFLVLLVSSMVGAIVGSLVIVLTRKASDHMLPFGTFIGFTALAAVFWWRLLWRFIFAFGH